MRPVLLLCCVLLLAACGGPRTVTRADLEPLLYQDGDAPAGHTPGQFRDALAAGNEDAASLVVARDLAGGGERDEVAVLVYADAATAQSALLTVLPGITENADKVDGIGNAAIGLSTIVIFQRCRAVGFVRMGNVTAEQIATYSQRLDERIRPVVC